MALIGAALFVGGLFWGGLAAPERPRIVISASRLDLARRTFVQDYGRPPEREEWAALVDSLIDQEVLYRYALRLRMHEEPAAQRRLAQIATFVDATPDRHRPEPELAAQAVKLGLHESDLVVRRILADGARRLIRAVVLTRQPLPEMVEDYLRANPDQFRRPAQIRITHVAVDGFKWPTGTKERAAELLDRLRSERRWAMSRSSRRSCRFSRARISRRDSASRSTRRSRRLPSGNGRDHFHRVTAITWSGCTKRSRRTCRRWMRSATRSRSASCRSWRTTGWCFACSSCAPSSTS